MTRGIAFQESGFGSVLKQRAGTPGLENTQALGSSVGNVHLLWISNFSRTFQRLLKEGKRSRG